MLVDYLRGRAFRRFAGTPLRLLVTGFAGVGGLKQAPKAVFQLSDGPLQGAELSNPLLSRRTCASQMMGGATLQTRVERIAPGNKARRQQPDSIS